MKKNLTPMSYRFELGNGKWWGLDLPCPIEQLTKKDRIKLANWIKKAITAQFIKSKWQAKARYDALLEEAEKLKEDFDL